MGGYLLLLEDDADIVEALDLLFASEGIPWRGADAPIERERPSLALLDLSMDGTAEMAARLRALGVPIIVASASPDAQAHAAALGAAECLEKPFDLGRLLGAVHRIAPHLSRKA